jgi:circadian clock protein KaiB
MSSEGSNKAAPEANQQDLDISTQETLKEFENLVANLARPSYVFQLYVAGTSTRSSLAIANVRGICEQYLPGRYKLEVIDVYQQPAATKQAQVVAVPTLIKEVPFPPQRFIGDMSNAERIVVGLKLRQ